jgi:regulator of cell morphogenesis and NO signaling
MNILESKTVADLVTENIQTAHIFKKYGIDFCCGGGINLKMAAEKAEIKYVDLEKELLGVENTTGRTNNYNNWNLDFLTDHIVNFHHASVQESIPMIYQYALRVVRVYGSNYPELLQVQRLFSEISRELRAHLKKEEEILFPFIKNMVKVQMEGSDFSPPDFGTVDNPIKMMETEHEEAGGILRQISALTNNYTPPQGACNTFKAFYAKLEEFEQDLHQHVHLENNILFPKALKLEQQLSVL